MGTVLKISQIPKLVQNLKKQKKSTVLAGGCFDVLHPGHVIFLEKAKKVGDCLIVLLESDQKIKKLKGVNRPVHNQRERAKVLSAISAVDYIVLLPFIDSKKEYDALIGKIDPDIIAATKGSKDNYHQERTAKLIGANLKYVTKMIVGHSTSSILNSNLGARQ